MSHKMKNECLAKSLSKIYLDAASSDVKFKFNNGEDGQIQFVPAHKAILGSESSVFYAMFFGPLKEGEIVEITDASAEAFQEFIQLFYLPEVPITLANIDEVIRLADKYEMLDHINMCITLIKEKLTDDNIFWGYQLAFDLDNEQLKQICEERLMLASPASNIFESEAFLHCDQQVLEQFLQTDLMLISESEVFNACVAWAKSSCEENGLDASDPSNWKKQLGHCFYLIRFGAMAKADIDAIMSNERYTGLFERDELIDILRITSDENHKSTINYRMHTFLEQYKVYGLNSAQFDNLKINPAADVANVISFARIIYEKAIENSIFSSVYAKLFRNLYSPRFNELVEAQVVFKKELLMQCQDGLKALISDGNFVREKLKEIQLELNKTTDSNYKLELSRQMKEEERKLRRDIGIVRFMGELYCLKMYSTSILENCVVRLLEIGTDKKLEILCELLTIVGRKMERKAEMKSHYQTMEQIASDTSQANTISNRVRSMLKNVIEIRQNKWVRHCPKLDHPRKKV